MKPLQKIPICFFSILFLANIAKADFTISQEILDENPDVNSVYTSLTTAQNNTIESFVNGEKSRARYLRFVDMASEMTARTITQVIDDTTSNTELQNNIQKYVNMESQNFAIFYAMDYVPTAQTEATVTKNKIIDLVNDNDCSVLMANAALRFIHWSDVANETDFNYITQKYAFANAKIDEFYGETTKNEELLIATIVKKEDNLLTEYFTPLSGSWYRFLRESLEDILANYDSATTRTFVRSIVNYLIEEHSAGFEQNRDYDAKEGEIFINSSLGNIFSWAARRGKFAVVESWHVVRHYKKLLDEGQNDADIIAKEPVVITDFNALRSVMFIDIEVDDFNTFPSYKSWRVNNYDEIDANETFAENCVDNNYLIYLVSLTHSFNPVGVNAFANATDYNLYFAFDTTSLTGKNSFVVIKDDDSVVRGTVYGNDNYPSITQHLYSKIIEKSDSTNAMILVTGLNQNACQFDSSRDLALAHPTLLGRIYLPNIVTITPLDLVFDSGVTAIDDSKHYTFDLLNIDNYRKHLAFVSNHLIFKSSDKFTKMKNDNLIFKHNDWQDHYIYYDGNGNSDGFYPTKHKKDDDINTSVRENTGNLKKDGFVFSGWNTKFDGSGSNYPPGTIYSENKNLNLFAKWSGPFVNITNTDFTVKLPSTTATISGTNNALIAVNSVMWWENTSKSGATGTFTAPASGGWTIENIQLAPSDNIITVYGSNLFGDINSDSITINSIPEPVLFINFYLLFIIYYRRNLGLMDVFGD